MSTLSVFWIRTLYFVFSKFFVIACILKWHCLHISVTHSLASYVDHNDDAFRTQNRKKININLFLKNIRFFLLWKKKLYITFTLISCTYLAASKILSFFLKRFYRSFSDQILFCLFLIDYFENFDFFYVELFLESKKLFFTLVRKVVYYLVQFRTLIPYLSPWKSNLFFQIWMKSSLKYSKVLFFQQKRTVHIVCESQR